MLSSEPKACGQEFVFLPRSVKPVGHHVVGQLSKLMATQQRGDGGGSLKSVVAAVVLNLLHNV